MDVPSRRLSHTVRDGYDVTTHHTHSQNEYSHYFCCQNNFCLYIAPLNFYKKNLCKCIQYETKYGIAINRPQPYFFLSKEMHISCLSFESVRQHVKWHVRWHSNEPCDGSWYTLLCWAEWRAPEIPSFCQPTATVSGVTFAVSCLAFRRGTLQSQWPCQVATALRHMTAHPQLGLVRTGLTARMHNVPHNRICFVRCVCEF